MGALWHEFKIADHNFDVLAVGRRGIETPQIDTEWQSLLRNIDGGIVRRVGPGFDETCGASNCLKVAQQEILYAVLGPNEARRGKGASVQREAETQLTDCVARCGVVRKIAVGSVGLPPKGIFDIDFIGAVRTNARGRTVREEPQHNVLVEYVDWAIDLPLVGSETQSVGGEQFGSGPRARIVGDLEV